jgi:putative flippase GtrA
MSWSAKLGPKIQALVHEFAKFGVVGLLALIVDVGLFNLLLYVDASPLYDKPLSAKAVGVITATTVAYFGNRFWTFRSRGSLPLGRGYLVFFGLNAIAMLIAMACLAVSHYVLGLTGPLADNISANVVGLVLGTLFRFWSYRRFVFPQLPQEQDRKALIGTVEI